MNRENMSPILSVLRGDEGDPGGTSRANLLLGRGVALVVVAFLLPNPAARSVCLTQKSPLDDGGAADVAYEELAPASQAAYDGARDVGQDEPFVADQSCSGLPTVGRFAAPTSYDLLSTSPTVAVNGTVYRTFATVERTTLGSSLLWVAIVALASTLVGLGLVLVRGRALHVATGPIIPLAVGVVCLVVTLPTTGFTVTNTLRVALNAGFAVASVALLGASWSRRSMELGVVAAGTLALSSLVLVGSGTSLLPAMVALILLGVPVGWLGYRAARDDPVGSHSPS